LSAKIVGQGIENVSHSETTIVEERMNLNMNKQELERDDKI